MSSAAPARWAGRRVTQARAWALVNLPAVCGQCGKGIPDGAPWVLGHIRSRALHPELTWETSNWQREHRECSNRSAQAAVIEKAKAEALRDAGFFPQKRGQGEPNLPVHIHTGSSEPTEIREGLTWARFVQRAPAWLEDLLEVPEDASPPLAISPVHPEAVGTYGPQFEAWALTELGVTLRWWQRLAAYMQLQHRADGSLCVTTVVESTPRRSGKSTRLRATALWRIAHPEMWGEPQLALMCGKDLSIAREIHQKSWPWAKRRKDAGLSWDCKKGVGQEETFFVSEDGEPNRWLVRSLDSVYGWDVGTAQVDEAWGVSPAVVADGLEPAMLERHSAQLLLTSTSHRKATSLMPGRISAVLAEDDPDTLLLWWGVLASTGADDDPDTWRAASPHWTPAREKTIRTKYTAAVLAAENPTLDDPDPVGSWRNQYLNSWRLSEKRTTPGKPLVAEEHWDALLSPEPTGIPAAVAVEADRFGEGVSVALTYEHTPKVLVSVSTYSTAAEAAQRVQEIRSAGFGRRVLLGASLLGDPAFARIPATAQKTTAVAAVEALSRLLSEGVVLHDGSPTLSDQVLATRLQPSADGNRLISKGRSDAIKASIWAINEARKPKPINTGIILPSSAQKRS